MSTKTRFDLRPDLRVEIEPRSPHVVMEILEGYEDNILNQFRKMGYSFVPPAGSPVAPETPATTEPSSVSEQTPALQQVLPKNVRVDGLQDTVVYLSKAQARSIASCLMGAAAEL